MLLYLTTRLKQHELRKEEKLTVIAHIIPLILRLLVPIIPLPLITQAVLAQQIQRKQHTHRDTKPDHAERHAEAQGVLGRLRL